MKAANAGRVGASRMTPGLTWLLATTCGLIVANVYYAQPLIALIAPDIGLHPTAASLIVTVTQAGYCAGLVLLVPLGDKVENRRLVVWLVAGAALSLAVAAGAKSAAAFLGASLGIGLMSVAIQVMVPIAAHMSAPEERGRVVGNVLSGLLVGIMLARPVASFVADAIGWRGLFAASGALMAAVALTLRRLLPLRQPTGAERYAALIGSLGRLLRRTPLLRRRGAYQAAMFGAFSLFWTAVPLHLAGAPFHLGQRGIALFALAGAAGAVAAPVAGRLADRGHARLATGLAMGLVGAAFALAWTGQDSIVALVASAVLLDLGVQANLVIGQRAIFELGEAVRSRLNGLFLALFFAGGALGSGLASVAFAHAGWGGVAAIGGAFAAAALLYFATERR